MSQNNFKKENFSLNKMSQILISSGTEIAFFARV